MKTLLIIVALMTTVSAFAQSVSSCDVKLEKEDQTNVTEKELDYLRFVKGYNLVIDSEYEGLPVLKVYNAAKKPFTDKALEFILGVFAKGDVELQNQSWWLTNVVTMVRPNGKAFHVETMRSFKKIFKKLPHCKDL